MSVALGRKEAEMAAHLQGYVLNHKAQSLKPRGLSNRSNWCFVNAIMQALVACPPFFNLMKSLPAEIMYGETIHLLNSPLKILAAVNAFVAEFTPLENFPRMNHHRRDKNKKPEDLPLGKTFEAATIFQVLLNLNSDTFKVIEGRQEDAEEFLTFLLNGLNDEMLSVLKLVNNNDCNNPTDEENPKVSKIEDEEGADEWQEVGPKNKSCITRRGGDLVTFFPSKTNLATSLFRGNSNSK
jgi:ubiquitin carboxyl-terminal hydrolase 10